MDCTTHFLIKEDIFRAAIHVVVIAKGELTEPPCPFIHAKHFVKVVLALRSRGFDDDTVFEAQTHILDGTTAEGGWETVANVAISRVLNWAGEELSTGEVVVPAIIEKGASID